MRIIEPYEITSEILRLINTAEKELFLVSPYVNFQNWETIKTEIKKAQKRGVKVNFYTRLETDNFKSWEEIESLEITPKLIKNLHAKLYYNEKLGIVTSMNLLTSSNLNAIEFGAIYDTNEELGVLKDFVNRFLEPNIEEDKPNDEDIYLTKEKFVNVLTHILSSESRGNVYCKWENSCYKLNVRNQFYFGIDKVKNIFWIEAIISGWENENAATFIENTSIKDWVHFELKGNIRAISKMTLTSSFLDNLKVYEKRKILDIITRFVIEWLQFKDYCRNIKY
ncbi:hypothetical protein ACI76Y_05360 [Capnocytophaga cynodegmi]|uniref:hypothetical protein n=1 Tax=Capnocytophaga cynodegmi TaxID=28189 RepID=UPI00385A8105